MFIKTIAVGPLDDVASWVTGGTTVAIGRIWQCEAFGLACRVFTVATLDAEDEENCLYNCDMGFRTAMSLYEDRELSIKMLPGSYREHGSCSVEGRCTAWEVLKCIIASLLLLL